MKKIGIILIIISIVLLLAGNSIGDLWPITEKLFKSSIITFIGFIGIIFLEEGSNRERQTKLLEEEK